MAKSKGRVLKPQIQLSIGGEAITPGTRKRVDIPLPDLSSQTQISMPIHVIHGMKPGPVMFVCAAIHGDELNGIEIIRTLLASKAISNVSGTLLCIPVVNVYGLINQSRYLPDRRDLNRTFPGSKKGSLAARLSNLFIEEIVSQCTHGIDLHTGSGCRTNLPQIRADLDHPETRRLAQSFGVPVLLNSSLRDGSLRAAADELGIPMLLYEAGEASRYDDISIRAGVKGIYNVMRSLGMLPARKTTKSRKPFIARSSRWIRAPQSGLFRSTIKLGASVSRGDILGYIAEAADAERVPVKSGSTGIVIGRLESPLVHEGDAIIHIARFKADSSDIAEQLESFHLDYTIN
jgi:predicted deacylase